MGHLGSEHAIAKPQLPAYRETTIVTLSNTYFRAGYFTFREIEKQSNPNLIIRENTWITSWTEPSVKKRAPGRLALDI